jgi:hypothetical protein
MLPFPLNILEGRRKKEEGRRKKEEEDLRTDSTCRAKHTAP